MARVSRRWRFGEFNVVGAALSTIAAMMSLTFGTGAFADRPLVGVALIALGLVFGALVGLFVRWDNARLEAVNAPDRARWEEFGSREGWLVDLIVLQGDAPTGRDRGILWIEGARLNFAGDRCSFSLAPGDIAGACRKVKPIRNVHLSSKLPLARETAGGRLALSFGLPEPSAEGRRLLHRDLDAFVRLDIAGKGQLPPIALGPGASSIPGLLLWVGMMSAVWIVTLGLFAGILSASPNWQTFLYGSIITLWCIAVCGGLTLRRRWSALRDRVRLRE